MRQMWHWLSDLLRYLDLTSSVMTKCRPRRQKHGLHDLIPPPATNIPTTLCGAQEELLLVVHRLYLLKEVAKTNPWTKWMVNHSTGRLAFLSQCPHHWAPFLFWTSITPRWLGHVVGNRACTGEILITLMSAIGTKQTSRVALHMSAFGGKADMPFCAAHVCF